MRHIKGRCHASLDGSGNEKAGQCQRSVCDVDLDHFLLLYVVGRGTLCGKRSADVICITIM